MGRTSKGPAVGLRGEVEPLQEASVVCCQPPTPRTPTANLESARPYRTTEKVRPVPITGATVVERRVHLVAGAHRSAFRFRTPVGRSAFGKGGVLSGQWRLENVMCRPSEQTVCHGSPRMKTRNDETGRWLASSAIPVAHDRGHRRNAGFRFVIADLGIAHQVCMSSRKSVSRHHSDSAS